MKIAVISFSNKGEELGNRIAAGLRDHFGADVTAERCRHGALSSWTSDNFEKDALIFVGSCGIAVRAVAPFVTSKLTDPAVAVIDETGRYCISLLSGHIGGANRLVRIISGLTGSEPVITTATDRNGVFSVDAWASSMGMKIYDGRNIMTVADKLLSGAPVTMVSEVDIGGTVPFGVSVSLSDGRDTGAETADILVSYHNCHDAKALHLVPPVLVMGIGCRRGTTFASIQEAFSTACEKLDLHPSALCSVSSVDLKKDETGIREFCQFHGVPFHCYSADELNSVDGDFTPSGFVSRITGTDNVCERSAAAECGRKGRIIMHKTVVNGIALSFSVRPGDFTFDDHENR